MAGELKLPREWLLQALELETNREAGSEQLVRQAVDTFRAALEQAWTPDADAEQVRSQLSAFAARLRRARSESTALAQALERVEAALRRGREAALAETEAVLRSSFGELAQAAESLFRPGTRVLVLGHEETVLKLLVKFADRLEAVTVSEGRPRSRGVAIAAALADQALPVRLITEAQLELFAPECDLALLQAERVLPDGAVVAPAGTAVAARVCAAHGRKVYVVAERSRWVGERDPAARFTTVPGPPSEVLAEAPPGVEVANVQFDRTPAELITGYLTEEGIRTGI
ncbi:MAG: hypothetical protein ACK47B_02430 [Armatimonadota bacterium]